MSAAVEAAAKARKAHGKGGEYAGIVCRECDEYFENREAFKAHAERAAITAALPHLAEGLAEVIRNAPTSTGVHLGVDTAGHIANAITEELKRRIER